MRPGALAGLAVLGLALPLAAPPVSAAEVGNTCVSCHELEEDEDLAAPVAEWRHSVHAEAEVGCDACHGGDPMEEDADLSMDEDEAGFLGSPGRREITDFCAPCHEEVAESFKTSVMGQRLEHGKRVASCVTCHMPDGHAIARADSAEILTVERCGQCHEGDRAIDLRDTLVASHSAIADADEALAELRHGIDTAVLDREVQAMRDRLVVIAHTYDLERIAEVSRYVDSRLDEIAVETAARKKKLRGRRLLGAGVVGFLALSFLALPHISRRMSPRRED